jgi:hypothetical protein
MPDTRRLPAATVYFTVQLAATECIGCITHTAALSANLGRYRSKTNQQENTLHPLLICVFAVPSVTCTCSYVSFVEILSTKAVEGFGKAGYGEAQAQRYACFAFFAGLMATWLLGKAVELISSCATAWRKHRVSRGSSTTSSRSSRSCHMASSCSRHNTQCSGIMAYMHISYIYSSPVHHFGKLWVA